MLSLGDCVQFACILEATARKPGSVHRFKDFDDLKYLDLLLSAAAIAPILDMAMVWGVGPTVWEAVKATRQVVKTNTNLGIVLLLAPLAAVPRDRELRAGVGEVLERLTVEDAQAAFAAIRLANPGGLGSAPQQDIREEPTLPFRRIMALAAERDLIARQYANGFREVFEIGVPALASTPLEPAIIQCHIRLLAAIPDSHIARRCGPVIAAEASRRAADVLAGADVNEFDAWLRADGHKRNPGTTADLVCASLFVALRQGRIELPVRF